MNGFPSMQQALAEQRIQQLHAEAAHARLVKEARAARRASRRPSRIIGLVAAVSAYRPARRSLELPTHRAPATTQGC